MKSPQTLLTASSADNDELNKLSQHEIARIEEVVIILCDAIVTSRERSDISNYKAVKLLVGICEAAIEKDRLPLWVSERLLGQFIRRCFLCVSKEGPQNGKLSGIVDLIVGCHPVLTGWGLKTADNKSGKDSAFETQASLLSRYGILTKARTVSTWFYHSQNK